MMKFKPNQTRTYDGEGFKRRAACLCFKNEKEDEVSLPVDQAGGWSIFSLYLTFLLFKKLRLNSQFDADSLSTQMYRTSFSAVFRAAGAFLACFDLQGRLSQETPVHQLCTTEETQLSVCWASLTEKKPSKSWGLGVHTQKYQQMLPFLILRRFLVLILCTFQPSCTDVFFP